MVVVDGPPVLDQPLTGLVDRSGDGHPAVVDVGVDGRDHVAAPERGERFSFPLLVGSGLATVGGQGDHVRPELVGQRAQRPTGVDGGQLAVVPDQDHLGSRRIGMPAELVEGAAADHGGLVDHDHVVAGQPTGLSQIGQQVGQRRARDAGARFEVGCRPGRHRRADDPEAGLLPADASGPEHGRLAGPGLADDQVVAVAGGEQLLDAGGLFAVQVGVTI